MHTVTFHAFRRGFSLSLAVTVLVLARGSLAVGPADTSSIPSQNDEFVGPFPSWSNLRAVYRAAGNGVADDTAAIQKALDELGTSGHSPVLFIRSGTYRITKTLVLACSGYSDTLLACCEIEDDYLELNRSTKHVLGTRC